MGQKTFRSTPEFKQETPGVVVARFATLNVIDADMDVTLPGAFGKQTVRMQSYGHDTWNLPIGKGTIREEGDAAIAELQINLELGQAHYSALKFDFDHGPPLFEWSYVFDILDEEQGEFEGQKVRFLKKLKVHSVDPVFLGAGVDTGTVSVKELGEKPFPNEYACRLRPPSAFQADSFRRTTRRHGGKKYGVIMGRLKGEDTMTDQAFRYPKDTWEPAEARTHCKDHDGTFEAASESASTFEEGHEKAVAALCEVAKFISRAGELVASLREKGEQVTTVKREHLALLLASLKQSHDDLAALLTEPKQEAPAASRVAIALRLSELGRAQRELAGVN